MNLSCISGSVILLCLLLPVGCNSTRVEEKNAKKDAPEVDARVDLFAARNDGVAPRTKTMLGLSYTERQKLIKDGVLHDGMKLSEAWKLLGPATTVFEAYLDEQPLRLHWYWNPRRLQVAPYFTATLRDGLLYDWKSDNR